jgi:hypothetical protein
VLGEPTPARLAKVVARRCPAGALGRMRVEHEDNAVTMGQAAGRAMAGVPPPTRSCPYFYSDLELGYEVTYPPAV